MLPCDKVILDRKFRNTRAGRYLICVAFRLLAACVRVLGFPMGVALEAYYHLIQQRLQKSLEPTSDIAVCVHLYYLDQWEMFARKLAAVDALRFDLFVTLPRPVRRFADTILADFPEAHVVVVPNRGRGTLPFIKVAKVLLRRDYEIALKIHCRHTAADRDGCNKLQIALDSLLPDCSQVLLDIVNRLRSIDVAIIGPSELYYRLDVLAYRNGGRLTAMVARRFGRRMARSVFRRQTDYGVFSASTFWVRLDTLTQVLHHRVYDFEPELHWRRFLTLPHQLEILFSLVPQLEGRQVLSTADGAVSLVGDSYAVVQQ